MIHRAFRVFYLGASYLGYQRQPSGQTVENYLELAFIKANAITSFDHNAYRGSSRTDVGVNAIGNTFVLAMDELPNLMLVNSHLPEDIVIWASASVPPGFHPRSKVKKQYSYFLPVGTIPLSRLELIHQYQGTHDFSSFIKKYGAGSDNPVCNISSISVETTPQFHIITIDGDNFGREQIRRMVGFLQQQKFHHLSPAHVLDTQKDIDVQAADGRFLFLRSITFQPPLDWEVEKKLDYRLDWLANIYQQKYSETQVVDVGKGLLERELI